MAFPFADASRVGRELARLRRNPSFLVTAPFTVGRQRGPLKYGQGKRGWTIMGKLDDTVPRGVADPLIFASKAEAEAVAAEANVIAKTSRGLRGAGRSLDFAGLLSPSGLGGTAAEHAGEVGTLGLRLRLLTERGERLLAAQPWTPQAFKAAQGWLSTHNRTIGSLSAERLWARGHKTGLDAQLPALTRKAEQVGQRVNMAIRSQRS